MRNNGELSLDTTKNYKKLPNNIYGNNRLKTGSSYGGHFNMGKYWFSCRESFHSSYTIEKGIFFGIRPKVAETMLNYLESLLNVKTSKWSVIYPVINNEGNLLSNVSFIQPSDFWRSSIRPYFFTVALKSAYRATNKTLPPKIASSPLMWLLRCAYCKSSRKATSDFLLGRTVLDGVNRLNVNGWTSAVRNSRYFSDEKDYANEQLKMSKSDRNTLVYPTSKLHYFNNKNPKSNQSQEESLILKKWVAGVL